MSAKLLVRPKQGLVVKNPLNGLPLPADKNTAVKADQFWLRRLAAGDVVEAKPEPPKKAAPVEPKAEEKKVSKKAKKSDEQSDE